MSNRSITVVGAVVVPVLLALCMGMVSVASTLATQASDGAAATQRIEQLEDAQKSHARSAARIEGTVTQMRVDQARFVGGVEARVQILESHHD